MDAEDAIRNFRPVPGVGSSAGLYRCGSTDGLGAKIRRGCCGHGGGGTFQPPPPQQQQGISWSETDALVLNDAGLVLDLRSSPERNDDDSRLWMDAVSSPALQQVGPLSSSHDNNNGGRLRRRLRRRPIRLLTIPVVTVAVKQDRNVELVDERSSSGDGIGNIFSPEEVEKFRYVIRLDILNRAELVGYVRDRWLSSSSSSASVPPSTASSTQDVDDDRYNAIMEELNRRGLAGLNEAILETRSGGTGLRLALQLVTLYREACRHRRRRRAAAPGTQALPQRDGLPPKMTTTSSIVFHCVQGKDRCVSAKQNKKSETNDCRLWIGVSHARLLTFSFFLFLAHPHAANTGPECWPC